MTPSGFCGKIGGLKIAVLVAALDRYIDESGHQNRSEAIRDLTRAGLAQLQEQVDDRPSGVAALVYYDHEERELAKRLIKSSHGHHDLSVATMHIHLDHDLCLEVIVLRGRATALQEMAAELKGLKGIHQGQLVLARTAPDDHTHDHPHERRGRGGKATSAPDFSESEWLSAKAGTGAKS